MNDKRVGGAERWCAFHSIDHLVRSTTPKKKQQCWKKKSVQNLMMHHNPTLFLFAFALFYEKKKQRGKEQWQIVRVLCNFGAFLFWAYWRELDGTTRSSCMEISFCLILTPYNFRHCRPQKKNLHLIPVQARLCGVSRPAGAAAVNTPLLSKSNNQRRKKNLRWNSSAWRRCCDSSWTRNTELGLPHWTVPTQFSHFSASFSRKTAHLDDQTGTFVWIIDSAVFPTPPPVSE